MWLEAPYGYGKSVLAMQWAELLESEGWRILWLSLEGQDPKLALAKLLGVPDLVPWSALLDELWQVPSLLVLEDLTGDEDLDPLLKHVSGLVLLASRSTLSYANLPRLMTEGYLLHLSSKQLAFSQAEANQLFPNKKTAQNLWQQTQGWSLPLHFASLTGETPERGALLKGMEASLSQPAWQEALFMASLPFLPQALATEVTSELVRAGFVQPLEKSYRLHPLIAEAITAAHEEAYKREVIRQGERLEPVMRAEAFARVDHREGLQELLKDSEAELHLKAPSKFVKWYQQVPNASSTLLTAYLAMAQIRCHQEEGLKNVERISANPDVPVNLRVSLLTAALHYLSYTNRFSEAQLYLDRAHILLDKAAALQKVGLLIQQAHFHYRTGDLEKARDSYYVLNDSLDKLNGSQLSLSTKGSIVHLHWELFGDAERALKLLSDMDKPSAEAKDISQWTVKINTAVFHIRLGAETLALKALNSLKSTDLRYESLWHRIFKAYLEQDLETLKYFVALAKKWDYHEFGERVGALLLRTLRRLGTKEHADTAFALRAELTGPLTCIEYSYFEDAVGNEKRAYKLLEQGRNGGKFYDLDHKLVWWAAHFRLTKKESSLDTLLALTVAGDKLFHYLLIPLEALPKHRPELSKSYALEEVLYSGWQGAIDYRLGEIPDLTLKSLGKFKLTLLGKEVDLTERQKELIALLLLGYDREVIGEAMWPEVSLKKMRNNLNVLFTTLRKTLEPWQAPTFLITSGANTYLTRTQADLWDLQQAIEEKDVKTVLKLYKEPFAPGVDLPLVSEAREGLKQAAVQCFLEAGRTSDTNTRVYLEKVLDLEPLNEEALQCLLELLLKLGRRTEATRRFNDFSNQLKEELDIEPAPATKLLVGVPQQHKA